MTLNEPEHIKTQSEDESEQDSKKIYEKNLQ